jgi:hypothetical protein
MPLFFDDRFHHPSIAVTVGFFVIPVEEDALGGSRQIARHGIHRATSLDRWRCAGFGLLSSPHNALKPLPFEISIGHDRKDSTACITSSARDRSAASVL